MRNPKDAYRCNFFINQNVEFRPYVADEKAADETFVKFLSDKDYGEAVGVFRFDIYVEPEINFGYQGDGIYMGCVRGSAHIVYDKFIAADSKNRHKILLNAALVLCKYIIEKVPLPKKFDGVTLVRDYAGFLKDNRLLLTDEEVKEFIIKPYETTMFNFVVSTTAEVMEKKNDIHYDLNKIRHYLNNGLSGKTFGKAVREFDFGYEIADSQGLLKLHEETANLRRYGAKYKTLLIVKQFDYRQLKGKTHLEQFNMLSSKILEAIEDTDKLDRKPKDFDKATFRLTIEGLLAEYADKFCR